MAPVDYSVAPGTCSTWACSYKERLKLMSQESETEQPIAETLGRSTKRRFKKRWIVWMILLVGLGPYLYFRATSFQRKIQVFDRGPAETEPVRIEGRLRVVTWNIAHGRGATFDNWAEGGDEKQDRVAEIASLIRELDADLVVLNEVDFNATWSGGLNQAEAIARQTGFRYYAMQSNLDFGFLYGRWHFGNVLLSHYPIQNANVVEFAPVNSWEPWVVGSKRGFLCDIKLADEQVVSMMGLHLEARGEPVRLRESRDVHKAAQTTDHPLIVAGDLNTKPRFESLDPDPDDGEDNAFENLIQLTGLSYQPTSKPSPQQLTFPSMDPESTIDWILFQEPELVLESQRVVSTQLSDHLPVMAEFQVNGSSSEPSGDD